MVGQNEIHHGLHHRHGSGQHTRVMSTFRGEGGGLSAIVDCLLLFADRCGGLEGHPDHNRLAVADASLNSAGIVGGCAQPAFVAGQKGIIVLAPF